MGNILSRAICDFCSILIILAARNLLVTVCNWFLFYRLPNLLFLMAVICRSENDGESLNFLLFVTDRATENRCRSVSLMKCQIQFSTQLITLFVKDLLNMMQVSCSFVITVMDNNIIIMPLCFSIMFTFVSVDQLIVCYICFYALSFQGAKVLGNFRSVERKLPYGTFAPRSECAEERKVLLPD